MNGKIEVQRDGYVATVIINNPHKRNAMGKAMWVQMAETIEMLSCEKNLRCVVLRGAGDSAFGSGADIEEFELMRSNKAQAIEFSKHGHKAMHAVRDCPIPTLAAIRGVCVGGGMELAAFCDLRIASEDSRFGIPINKLGATLAYPELEGLIRLIGPNVALEILLEGRVIGANEAKSKGIVNRVVSSDSFEEEILKAVSRIIAGAPLSARWHKKFIERLRSNSHPLDKEELAEGYACFDTQDYKAGYLSFLSKTKPQFEGR
ncbi:enoyl-CoA hydratase-related protein [Halomonas sp. KO116]|uniref:enoyl-CoA hydratase-related protein n=1 Tax=Halomonas sp. KO116 TaxID=1504981 RepID=UPI0004E3214D|nr:enoyl-CoA hydratase-related protein [Halomonas sp. KO116]AJY52330.1 Enoyl-CoA hydratase/isomerase [Halomonas sp. KO116]